MTKKIKLLILILLSLSVYFIYGRTKNTYMILTNIGDGLGIGVNSYGIEEYNAIEYYQDYLKSQKKEVVLHQNFSKKTLHTKELIEKIRTNPELKRELLETHILFLTIGYYDWIYASSTTEEKNEIFFQRWKQEFQKNYQELIQEIRKYYSHEIMAIGYYPRTKDPMEKEAILYINQVIQNQEEITYISTEFLLHQEEKYFWNPRSYYPNREGYKQISYKIIENT